MTDGPTYSEPSHAVGAERVQAAVDVPEQSALEGAGMAQDFFDAYSKVASGDWTEGLVNLAGGLYAARDFAKDPFGSFISMGLGWVIEHVAWLREPLDWLTGDQVQLDTMAATWGGIADQLTSAASDLDGYYTTDAHDWVGDTADEYREFCANRVDMYTCLAHSSKTISTLVTMSKVILSVVRTIVRELLTDFVGKTISMLVRYPPPVTPAAIPEVTATATTFSQRIMDWITKLRKAFGNASSLLKNLWGKVRALGQRIAQHAKYMGQSLANRHTFAAMYAKSADQLGGTVADVASHYARGFVADAFTHSAMGDAVRDGLKELPTKISVETTKETGKAAAAEVDQDLEPEQGPGVAPGRPEDAPDLPATSGSQQSYLAGGSGAHRVTGDLEES